jgi:hypothetical protein
MSQEIGRNDPCPCGSGKKYKKCCGAVKTGPRSFEVVKGDQKGIQEKISETFLDAQNASQKSLKGRVTTSLNSITQEND